MKRDPKGLADREFDVVVVGGGIQGAFVAWLAALGGLDVALIEQGDFGSRTSHNSFKLIHGGIRYLQDLDFPRIRHSINESRFWRWAAPGFVRPLAFVMPAYGYGMRSPAAMRAGALLHGMIGYDRNRGMDVASQLPATTILGSREVRAHLPQAARAGVRGGICWYDGQMQDADRILIRILQQTDAAGGRVSNYVRATGLIRKGARVAGVTAVDEVDGSAMEIVGSTVVLCCGPSSWTFLRRNAIGSDQTQPDAWIRGINVVVRKRLTEVGLGLPSQLPSESRLGGESRMIFFTPWHDCTVIGTSHVENTDPPDDYRLNATEVEEFLKVINVAYPELGLELRDLVYCYGGLTPADDAHDRSRSSVVVDHAATDGIDGLMSAVGVKYTTARHVASKVVDRLLRQRGLTPDSRAQSQRLFEPHEYEQYAIEAELDQLDERVRNAVRDEMATHLDDALLRRSHLAARGCLPETAIHRAAAVMGAELAWSPSQLERQLENLTEAMQCQLGHFDVSAMEGATQHRPHSAV